MPRFFFFLFLFRDIKFYVKYRILNMKKNRSRVRQRANFWSGIKRDVKQYGSKAIQRLKWTGNSWAVGERAFPLRSWLPHPLACAKALTCPRSRGTLRLFSTSKNYPKTLLVSFSTSLIFLFRLNFKKKTLQK